MSITTYSTDKPSYKNTLTIAAMFFLGILLGYALSMIIEHSPRITSSVPVHTDSDTIFTLRACRTVVTNKLPNTPEWRKLAAICAERGHVFDSESRHDNFSPRYLESHGKIEVAQEWRDKMTEHLNRIEKEYPQFRMELADYTDSSVLVADVEHQSQCIRCSAIVPFCSQRYIRTIWRKLIPPTADSSHARISK